MALAGAGNFRASCSVQLGVKTRGSVRLVAGAAALALTVSLAGCGASEEAAPQPPPPAEPATATLPATDPAPAPTPVDEPAQTLPLPVAQTRDAIVRAAHARNYDGLEALLDPAAFSYSFGESGDPVGYWRRLEDEGEVPILGDILPTVLGTPFARQDDIYAWPSAFAREPRAWTAEDREALRLLYSPEDIASFEEAGGYLGWRVGIRADGTWLFFVAGD